MPMNCGTTCTGGCGSNCAHCGGACSSSCAGANCDNGVSGSSAGIA